MSTVLKAPADLSVREIVRSLASDVCPGCNRVKRPKHSFCGSCYMLIPKPRRLRLYYRLGDGYERAFVNAFDALGVDLAWIPVQPEEA